MIPISRLGKEARSQFSLYIMPIVKSNSPLTGMNTLVMYEKERPKNQV